MTTDDEKRIKKITLSVVRSFNPCAEYTDDRISELLGLRGWLTPLEVCDLPISVEDKFWLLLRKEFLSAIDLRLFACDCAQRVMHLVPDGEDRPQMAIDVAIGYAMGTVDDTDLAAASDAAWDAAWDAGAAAKAAASDAAWAAAGAAASAAARAAAGAAAEKKVQLEILKGYL